MSSNLPVSGYPLMRSYHSCLWHVRLDAIDGCQVVAGCKQNNGSVVTPGRLEVQIKFSMVGIIHQTNFGSPSTTNKKKSVYCIECRAVDRVVYYSSRM